MSKTLKQLAEENKVAYHNACLAVEGRGGEIPAQMPFGNLANAIKNIPHDNILAYQKVFNITNTIRVPQKSEKVALVGRIGGMSYKSNNILKLKTLNETQNGVTITTNPDGSYTLNGTSTDGFYFNLLDTGYWATDDMSKAILSNRTVTFSQKGFTWDSSDGERKEVYLWICNVKDDGSGELWTYDDELGTFTFKQNEGVLGLDLYVLQAGIVFNNVTFTIMVNEGTTALPYEPYFEGIRNGKTTSIVSEGANKVRVLGWSASGIYGDKTALVLTNKYNTTIDTTEAVNRIEVTQSNWVEGGGYSSPNGEFNGKLSKTLTAGKTYVFSADIELTHCPLNLTSVRLTIDNNVMFAFERLKLNTKIRVSKSFVYIPSSYDICRLYFSLNGNSIVLSDIMITEQEVTDISYKPFVGTLGVTNIPEAITSREGYCEGYNSDYYNYVEWREGRCYEGLTCKKIVFNGTEGWYAGSLGTENQYFALEGYPLNAILNGGIMTDYSATYINGSNKNIGWQLYKTDKFLLRLRPANAATDFPTLADWKAYLNKRYANGNPLTFLYALAEPIETDITNLMTVDNAIIVEGGGTVEFINEYDYDTPSETTYIINTVGG